MTISEQKVVRDLLQVYHKKSTILAISIFLFDLSIYCAAVAGIIYFEELYLKIACSLVAGTMTSALFVLGHDAAHGALTESKKLNDIIGRIVFLPSLHNFSMWQIMHNKMHHATPNLKGFNSWSPMSLEEYVALPTWRKILERMFRTPAGFGPYYLSQRWWKHKFYPWNKEERRTAHIWDFVLLMTFLICLVTVAHTATQYVGHSTTAGNLVWIALVPFIIWNNSMGWTVYIQHTHQRIPWFENRHDWEAHYAVNENTPYIKFPRWFGYIFHDINEHTAHHLAPKIPCYQIFKAQKVVENKLAGELVAEKFSILELLKRMRMCKLYDYRNHQWINFKGEPTAAPSVV